MAAPTKTAKKITPVRLPPETLGAKFHRAYKLARRTTRPGLIHRDFENDPDLAKFVTVSGGTISRWEEQLISVEATQRRTLIALYYCLLFMGVDPRDFTLSPKSLGIDLETAKRAADLLTPLSLWSRINAA